MYSGERMALNESSIAYDRLYVHELRSSIPGQVIISDPLSVSVTEAFLFNVEGIDTIPGASTSLDIASTFTPTDTVIPYVPSTVTLNLGNDNPVLSIVNIGTNSTNSNPVTVNIGTGDAGGSVINIGSAGSTVNIGGTLELANLSVINPLITLNETGGVLPVQTIGAGFQIEITPDVDAGYFRTNILSDGVIDPSTEDLYLQQMDLL